jgi:toxin ParE1/3/4
MQIRWSPEAAEDLERIGRLIQRDKPIAAKNTVLTLYRGIADLKNFPNRGRSGRIEGTRELTFPSLPYIAVYRLHQGAVEVVRVYHGAQDWP